MPNIKVKGPDGEVLTFEGVERVLMDDADGGPAVPFSYGDAVENIPIALDLAEGDQQVVAEDGMLVKSATIIKPTTLTPDNIRSGVEVAGVDGEFIGDTEEATVELDMAEGDQVVEPSAYGKVLSRVTVKKPETLVPENIAKGIEIGGVIGTHTGGADLSDECLKYFAYNIDTTNRTITLYDILYDVIYANTGSYDVTIPDEIGGYSVIIACEVV